MSKQKSVWVITLYLLCANELKFMLTRTFTFLYPSLIYWWMSWEESSLQNKQSIASWGCHPTRAMGRHRGHWTTLPSLLPSMARVTSRKGLIERVVYLKPLNSALHLRNTWKKKIFKKVGINMPLKCLCPYWVFVDYFKWRMTTHIISSAVSPYFPCITFNKVCPNWDVLVFKFYRSSALNNSYLHWAKVNYILHGQRLFDYKLYFMNLSWLLCPLFCHSFYNSQRVPQSIFEGRHLKMSKNELWFVHIILDLLYFNNKQHWEWAPKKAKCIQGGGKWENWLDAKANIYNCWVVYL